MANYNKSFSFRNGIQVDDGNFVINPNGLIGIGTTVPSERFDLRGGTLKVVGLVTASDLYVTGFSTFTEVRLGTDIKMSSSSGIITATAFYGNGATLSNLPTSQWVDIDVGLGFTSIFNRGYVGVSTNDPRYTFQVGGNPSNSSQAGVGFNSTGSIKATGIITAGYFSGDGSSITGINADNITAGTLTNSRLPIINNDRFPPNINIAGIITATTNFSGNLIGNVTGNVNSTGLSTFSGGIVGNVIGIASTARSLTGTPDISVGVVTASIINSTSSLNVGTSGTVFNVTSSGKIGIGTTNPTSDLQVRKVNPLVEIIATSGESTLGIGQSAVGAGISNAILVFGDTAKSFDIVNNDTGNINMYLHGYTGVSGINTGRFAWIYGQTSEELASLTYDGKLGLGITNPSTTIYVDGTSYFAGISSFGNNVEISGTLTFGSGANKTTIGSNNPSILSNVNLNVTNGISTFGTIAVSSGSSIGIGTTRPTVGLDARSEIGLFNSIGIGTTAINYSSQSNLQVYGTTISSKIGIGTTNVRDSIEGVYSPGLLQVFGQANIYNEDLIMTGVGAIGINSAQPRSCLDMTFAKYGESIRGTFIPPVLSNGERDALYPNYSWPGQMIFNSSVNRHQIFDNITNWFNIIGEEATNNNGKIGWSSITTQLTVGGGTTITGTQLRVGTGVTITSGIITATNGFSSGIGTAVKITTVGNKLFFTVVGVGSTSLTLF
jgi:hypothetical protein